MQEEWLSRKGGQEVPEPFERRSERRIILELSVQRFTLFLSKGRLFGKANFVKFERFSESKRLLL